MPNKIEYVKGMRLHPESRLKFNMDVHDDPINRNALFDCDCGKQHKCQIGAVKNGSIKSCGCLNRELSSERSKTHGMSKTLIYKTWNAMTERCLNKNHKDYKNYGGRGITVCEEWVGSFERFYSDMGDKPSKKHSIDRIDNEKGYSKENCRWATNAEQNRNMRSNINLTFNGKTQCLTDWAIELGLKKTTLEGRLGKSGWSVEKALSTPPVSCADNIKRANR